jgi:hypothetical protein
MRSLEKSNVAVSQSQRREDREGAKIPGSVGATPHITCFAAFAPSRL